MSGAEKPIDLTKRRALIVRMGSLEKEFRELKRAFASPEALAKLALGEAQALERHTRPMVAAFKLVEPWLLEMMALHGAYLKLTGHDPSPSDALAMVTRNTSFATDVFRAAVLSRIAQLEDEVKIS